MKLVRSAILVTAALALPLVPAAAHADGSGHTDATGDVQSVTIANHDVVGTTATPEPATTNADITRVRARNGARAVKVVVRFAALNRTGDLLEHAVAIPSTAKNRLVVVDARAGHWAGKAGLYTPAGKRVTCKVRHKINYDLNKITVKVPQSCLGHPKAIKVGARTFVSQGSTLFYDDAYMTGGWAKDVFAWSPRIHR
jgi:hypothetical protein